MEIMTVANDGKEPLVICYKFVIGES